MYVGYVCTGASENALTRVCSTYEDTQNERFRLNGNCNRIFFLLEVLSPFAPKVFSLTGDSFERPKLEMNGMTDVRIDWLTCLQWWHFPHQLDGMGCCGTSMALMIAEYIFKT